MFIVSSTFLTAKRLVLVFVVVNGLAFLGWLAAGTYQLANSVDGSIAGWTGSYVEQAFWYAVGSTLFTTAAFGVPVLLAALVTLAVIGRTTGSRGS